MSLPRLYTLTECEELLGYTHRTLLQYVYDGKLQARKVGGKWKITEDDLRQFMQGKVKGTK